MAVVEAQLSLINLIAQFVILLISLTIAVYAIAASFLGKEYKKTLNQIKLEREKVENDLAEKMKSGEISKLKDIENTINCFNEKERQLRGRVSMISLNSVVVFPNVFFGLSLFVCVLSMLYYPSYIELGYLLDIIFLVVGLVFFSRALIGVQGIAQEIEGEGN